MDVYQQEGCTYANFVVFVRLYIQAPYWEDLSSVGRKHLRYFR